MAMASLTGCAAAPPEKIVPYVRDPENLLPGTPQFFATAMPCNGYGFGLIGKTHEGRPTKLEGNPDHPASLGATDIYAQASLLTLYDPERAQTVTRAAAISTWDDFVTGLQPQLVQHNVNGGDGLRILTETVTSPTLANQLQQLLRKFPKARWHQYEPINRDNARAGARLAFGRYVDTQYRFEDADVIVSLDSDFLTREPGKLLYARAFARRRKAAPGENTLNRLYVFESSPTITGVRADHRYRVKSGDIPRVAQAIAKALSGGTVETVLQPSLTPLIEDLQQHQGRSIVLAGDEQIPEVHALTHYLNKRVGNAGKTVLYTEPAEVQPVQQTQSLRELADDIVTNRVVTLIILNGNPVYNAPADLEFGKRLVHVPLRIHHSLYYDETSQLCQWHVPDSHYLESWGDVRAFDGTVSIIQPLILPLYESRTSYELMSVLLGDPSRSNYDIVRDFWQRSHSGSDFELFWDRALKRGVVPNTQTAAVTVSPRDIAPQAADHATQQNTLEIVFRPDPSLFDGRWANNAWLQELPKPITRLTWDNAALISPATAKRLNIASDDVVELEAGNLKLASAVHVWPGVADESITVYLGCGRSRGGQVGTNRGFNGYAIRTSAAMSIISGVQIRKTETSYKLVTTQAHHEMDHRHIARSITAAEYAKERDSIREEGYVPKPHETLYPPHTSLDYAWGMTVDLSACIGCNACVIACQAENNIPVVGKEEVARSREMHWIRIDAYTSGDPENPDIHFEPMLCQHCEMAPCELVCPVEATSHSAEGINEMTYNRCVGTRYCSNNCPYKVRRFNFFQYTEWNIPQFKMLYNPDVTVRSRGVMEKCTYCIQRINRARINAKVADRKIQDGEVLTACQQVCPAEAIIFGNLLDPNAPVTRSRAEPRNYGVLEELNTRPRTTYLARLTNPKNHD